MDEPQFRDEVLERDTDDTPLRVRVTTTHPDDESAVEYYWREDCCQWTTDSSAIEMVEDEELFMTSDQYMIHNYRGVAGGLG